MKICEIVVGPSGVTVGNAGADSIMLKPPQRVEHGKRPPQIGYGIKIGKRAIPTPGHNADDSRGAIGSNVPS